MGVVNLAVLACVFRMATKKDSQLFHGKKCTSRENAVYEWQ